MRFRNERKSTVYEVILVKESDRTQCFLYKYKRQPNPNGCLFKEKVFFTMGVAKNL